jgi:hypothetical protein
MITRIFRALLASGVLVFLSWSAPALADVGGDSRTVGNVAIYLGLLPAEMVRGHPVQHPESTMHGGSPATSGEYHVVVALFDAKTGARITSANVTARVAEVGLAGQEKTLQPMEIAGTETYGDYFKMVGNGPFRITVLIRLPGTSQDIKAEFEHRHQ